MQLTHLDQLFFQEVDAKKSSDFFSRFPAGISLFAKDVEDALTAVGEEATELDSRERRRALIRYSNPHGNAFAICHCTADPKRLVLLSSMIEVMWIHDDVTEELTHNEARQEHVSLANVLQINIDPSSLDPKNKRQIALARALRRSIDIDQDKAPKMIETLQHYLATFDCQDDDFDRMDNYMPYRIANCGYWISSYFIRWGMGIALSDEDYESIKEYDLAMGNILGLTNDYFSWEVEKDQPTDRIRNGVRVLMREYNLPSGAARELLLGMIVKEESKAARLRDTRLKHPVSKELSMYIEAIELYVGGSCYWHATAPRYRIYE